MLDCRMWNLPSEGKEREEGPSGLAGQIYHPVSGFINDATDCAASASGAPSAPTATGLCASGLAAVSRGRSLAGRSARRLSPPRRPCPFTTPVKSGRTSTIRLQEGSIRGGT
jgi:hypothetical protein